MKRAKSAAAIAFLTVLGGCLLLVLGGAARVAMGYPTSTVSRYHPGEEGVTYTGVVAWFKQTCQAFCTTELPGQAALMECNAAVNRLAGKWIFESTEVVRLKNGHLASAGHMY